TGEGAVVDAGVHKMQIVIDHDLVEREERQPRRKAAARRGDVVVAGEVGQGGAATMPFVEIAKHDGGKPGLEGVHVLKQGQRLAGPPASDEAQMHGNDAQALYADREIDDGGAALLFEGGQADAMDVEDCGGAADENDITVPGDVAA